MDERVPSAAMPKLKRYPTWNAKPGLSPKDVSALSPEFGARVRVRDDEDRGRFLRSSIATPTLWHGVVTDICRLLPSPC